MEFFRVCFCQFEAIEEFLKNYFFIIIYLFIYLFYYFIVACYLWQRFVIILLIVRGSCLILPVNEQTSRLSRLDCLMFQLCQTCLLLVYKQVKQRLVKIE